MAKVERRSLAARWVAWRTPQNDLMIGLIAPAVIVGMYHHMFGVALPSIRRDFGLDADTTAWVSMAYSLPFMALMPLYGRLGDGLGKRRLLLLGIALFWLGTVVIMTATSLTMLIVGGALMGTGTAGFTPLAIAIISQRFGVGERGRVMGVWNSAVPLTGLTVPYLAGLLVDRWGWQAIFPPLLVTGILVFVIVRKMIPERSGGFQYSYLREFDWTGVLLLGGAVATLLFYTSSRPITGVPAMLDMRLLGLSVTLFAALVYWERRRVQPYVNLMIFGNRIFTFSSLVAGLRMFLMSSIGFLMPLYLTDVHASTASQIGVVLALQAGALFLVSRAGGQIADRWGSRLPIVGSMLGLVGIMALLALLPASVPFWVIVVIASVHGLIIGISLAPLHRSAMHGIDEAEMGSAAGIYSMIRFAGQILGTALSGVLLQQGLERLSAPVEAYQVVFTLHVGVALLAALVGWGVREE
jgi:MFS family permease